MKNNLIAGFDNLDSKEWKQLIQYNLKGADYNETLVWESPEGLKVKPFYHSDEDNTNEYPLSTPTGFAITQKIFVFDIEKSNAKAHQLLDRGAERIYFIIPNKEVKIEQLFKNFSASSTPFYVQTEFLDLDYTNTLLAFAKDNAIKINILNDTIGQLVKDGNWFTNLNEDFSVLNYLNTNSESPFLSVNASHYLEAGANTVQEIAYTAAHVNEYFNRIENLSQPITIELAINGNYFFQIAKIRALRLILESLANEYNFTAGFHIIAQPALRNKTLYDYNVNMLRTTTECMSAILGGADAVSNVSYDALYHKSNEFGDRIARNQLLILKNESYLEQVANPADGSYYIENITQQLAEKALDIFKLIEQKDGLISQLFEGTIQRKIEESHLQELERISNGKDVLVGTTKYQNSNDKMKDDLELFPFQKTNPRKTIIKPLIYRRLAEAIEKERLETE